MAYQDAAIVPSGLCRFVLFAFRGTPYTDRSLGQQDPIPPPRGYVSTDESPRGSSISYSKIVERVETLPLCRWFRGLSSLWQLSFLAS